MSKKFDDAPQLSKRELQVLTLAAHGKTYAEISHLLSVTENTAKAHIERISHKLYTKNKTHAVAVAISLGLVRVNSTGVDE